MTFSPDVYQLLIKDYPMFIQWSMTKDLLFFPKGFDKEEDEQYDLTSKIYVMMKRLSQSYFEILKMDSDERDKIFELELKLIEEERKQQEQENGRTK